MATKILNKLCVVEADIALRNSSFFVKKLRATILLVSVVPIFAPMIIGMACAKSIDPDATIATIMEVVVELLCIMAVVTIPMNKLIKGLLVMLIIL